MVQIDKESKRQKSKLEKSKAALEKTNPIRIQPREEDPSSSSMSMYIFDSNGEDYMAYPTDLPLL
jgi:hypothetical protein